MVASVLARLKSKIAESSRNYQLICQEGFLRRLEESKYAENLMIGGLVSTFSVETSIAVSIKAITIFLLLQKYKELSV